MTKTTVFRKSAVVTTMVVALAGIGAGAAWAGTPGPTPPPPPANTHPGQPVLPPPGRPLPPPPPRPVPVTDAGRVVTANPHTLTVRGNDGRISVFQLTPRTAIVKFNRPSFAGQLAPRDRVQVTGTRVGVVETATRVVDSGR